MGTEFSFGCMRDVWWLDRVGGVCERFLLSHCLRWVARDAWQFGPRPREMKARSAFVRLRWLDCVVKVTEIFCGFDGRRLKLCYMLFRIWGICRKL